MNSVMFPIASDTEDSGFEVSDLPASSRGSDSEISD
jgi:hypothetical protein